jgi:hypothetical protein
MTEGVQSSEVPSADLIARIRLTATLHWMTKSKFEVHDDFLRNLRAPLSAFHQGWPLQVDPNTSAQLAWDTFPRLRLMVYAQFAVATGNAYITDRVKALAQQWFVGALGTVGITKSAQITHALGMCCNPHALEVYRRSTTFREWCRFWNEDLPRPVEPDVHEMSRPHRQAYHDLSRPHGQGDFD